MQTSQLTPDHKNVDLQFHHHKEHLSKLKFTLIELETKLNFLKLVEVRGGRKCVRIYAYD